MPHPRQAHRVPAWSGQAGALFLPASLSAQMPTPTPPFRPGPLAAPQAGVGTPQLKPRQVPPATYRSATGLIALRRCARDQRSGPAEGSRSEGKCESECDSERHGHQNAPPRPTAPRQPAAGGPPTRPGGGASLPGGGATGGLQLSSLAGNWSHLRGAAHSISLRPAEPRPQMVARM